MSELNAGSTTPKVRFEIKKTTERTEKNKENEQNDPIQDLLQSTATYEKDWSKADADIINEFEPTTLKTEDIDKDRYIKAWNWYRNALSKDIWNTESVAKFLVYANPYEIQKFWRYTYHTHTHIKLDQWLDIVNRHIHKIDTQNKLEYPDYQINPSAILIRNTFKYVKFSEQETKCHQVDSEVKENKDKIININSTGEWNKSRAEAIQENFESRFQYNQGTSIKIKTKKLLKENLKYIQMLQTLDIGNTDAEINFGENIDAKINLSINSTDLENPAEIIIVSKDNPNYIKHQSEIKENYLYEEISDWPYSVYVWIGLLKFNRDKITNWILTGKLRWYPQNATLVIPQSWFTLKISNPTSSFITRTLRINWNYRKRKRKFNRPAVSKFKFEDLFKAV